MRQNVDLLFALIRYELTGTDIACDARTCVDGERLKEIVSLARRHNLVHLVYDALYRKGMIQQDNPTWTYVQQAWLAAVWRTTNIDVEFQRICHLFDAQGVPYIPLKGSVLRQEYPKPWMRTSDDIDILVHEEDLERAQKALEGMSYRLDGKHSHDWSFYLDGRAHLELHFDLIEEGRAVCARDVLRDIWDYAYCVSGNKYVLSDDMFYFYHIAHMAKHCEHNECGIRPFLDLWILNQRQFDSEKRVELLKRGGLVEFANHVEALMRYWLIGSAPDSVTERFEECILHGAILQNINSRDDMRYMREGKLYFLLKRAFLSFDDLKLKYAILENHPLLFPALQVRRWIDAVRASEGSLRIRKEWNNMFHCTDEDLSAAEQFWNELGLK